MSRPTLVGLVCVSEAAFVIWPLSGGQMTRGVSLIALVSEKRDGSISGGVLGFDINRDAVGGRIEVSSQWKRRLVGGW